MRFSKVFFFWMYTVSFSVFSQNTAVEAIVYDITSYQPITGVKVSILGTAFEEITDSDGLFVFAEEDYPIGQTSLVFSKKGYLSYTCPVILKEGKKLSGLIFLIITNDERKRINKIRKEAGLPGISKFSYNIDKRVLTTEATNLSYESLSMEPVMDMEASSYYQETSMEEITPVSFEETPPKEIIPPAPEPQGYTYLQRKYAEILEIPPEEIANTKLYQFVDEWMGTPYKLGGNNKSGIDCSSFTLSLFGKVYSQFNIGRTAKQQFMEVLGRKKAFKNPENLKEGDLVFFGNPGDRSFNLNHVGIYLGNYKFVNSTSRKGPSGISGVKISDLRDTFWKQRFKAGGRW